MKLMILIPCMDMVHTEFMRSLLLVDHAGHDISYGIKRSSLIYDSRNQLLDTARKSGVDRVLWLDSDMAVPMNAIRQLSEDIDGGCDIVSGIYYKRRPPCTPVIYKECRLVTKGIYKLPTAKAYEEYPKDSLFEVEAFGFGCVMMTIEAADRITNGLGLMPFMPTGGFGEDLSFCMRARHVGLKLWADSRVRCGHIGLHTYTEEDYERHK